MRHPFIILGALLLLLGVEAVVVIFTTPNTTSVKELVPFVSDHPYIKVFSPSANSKVSSPLRITGQVKGTWFFEASFPIVIVDWDGRIIGQGYATAIGNWMTSDMVSFTAEIAFTRPDYIVAGTYNEKGAIIFKKDNPSGLPENDGSYEMPIIFQ